MLNLFYRLWDLIKSFVNLIVPIFQQVPNLRGLRTATLWIIRIVLLALIVAGLTYVNYTYAIIHEWGDELGPWLKWHYLPILFLMAVGLAWLGVLFWRLLTAEVAESDFPDIDEAWEEAKAALAEARIDLTNEPLFLVLGETQGGEGAFFKSAFNSNDRPLLVTGDPQRPGAPLHIWVGEFKPRPPERDARRGLFVTCTGCSLLAKLSEDLSGAADEDLGGGAFDGEAPDNLFATMTPKEVSRDVQDIVASMVRQKRPLSPEEQEALRNMIGADDDDLARRVRQARARLFQDTAEVARLQARLRHLCRLITRDRRPWCAANGILVILPWTGTDTQEIANQTVQACRQDLEVAREALQVNCPAIALVADMETAPGFPEFIRRIPRENRNNRVGRRFDLSPALHGTELTGMIATGMQWFCTAMLTRQIYQFFDLESSRKADVSRASLIDGNVRLHQVLTQLLERQKRLAWVLQRGFLREKNGPPLFGGCYLAGTGRTADQQVFVAGVLYRLIEEQNNIAWTDEAREEDIWYHRAARGAWAAAVLLLAGLGGLLYYHFVVKGGGWKEPLALCVPLALIITLVLLSQRRSS